jgi:hypothetical protein
MFRVIAVGLSGALLLACRLSSADSAQTGAYPSAAPLDQYLLSDAGAEIALARSAAPASISGQAEVRVLTRSGYTTQVKGTNGFMCLVERSWGTPTDDPQFWNPKIRSPTCFNAAATRTFVPIYLMKTRLVLAGKSPAEVGRAVAAALASKELPALDPAAMCYMMSRQQYVNDTGVAWHPHLMFFVSGSVAPSWGADVAGSPVLSSDDPEEHVTIFMVPLGRWSDGSAAEAGAH